jgi:hypothetical protein
MVSLNCMVAVMKMFSVADNCFPLERKSFTYRERESGSLKGKFGIFGSPLSTSPEPDELVDTISISVSSRKEIMGRFMSQR